MSDPKQENTLHTIHIGSEIERVMREQRRSASWLASMLYCDRTNIYKIFLKSSIDTSLLMRISVAMSHDFFEHLSSRYRDHISDDNQV